MKINSRKKEKINLAITIILVLGIVILVNFFAYHFFLRFDLTENKSYSISSASKNVVRNLDDVVQVKLYFSKDLPQEYESLRQNVRDILNEYSNYSGNFRVEEVVEINDEDAYRLEIPKLQFNVLKKDQFQVVNGYLGMSVEYYDRQEVIPVVQAENLEYQLTSILKKLTSEKLPTIGFLTSHQTPPVNENLTVVMKDLQQIYQVREINLPAVENIDPEIKTLILVNPQGAFSDADQRKLDNFLMQGNSVFVLQDMEGIYNMQVYENKTNLNEWLMKYGVQVNKELVLDQSNAVASFDQGMVTFSVNYPFWVRVLSENLNQDNPAVAKLDSLVLPWTGSVSGESVFDGSKVFSLAKTTNKAWKMTENFNLNPSQFNPSVESEQADLALEVFGIKSAYSEQFNQDAHLVVVGDSEFMMDGFLQSYPYNKSFFLNIVDYLSLDQDLINIRSKEIVIHPIKELSDTQKQLIKYGNVFGLTIVVIAFGIVRYYLRRRSNNLKF